MEQLLSPYLVALFWVSLLMPMGVLLRNKIPFLQNNLVPSSLIAGFMGMILMNFDLIGVPTQSGWAPIEFSTYALLTTLIFTTNYILIGLSSGRSGDGNGMGKEMTRGVIWLSVTFVGSYGILIVTGAGVIWAYNFLSGSTLETATSMNLVSGFTGGPAQALTIAQLWVDNTKNPDVFHLMNISDDVLVMAVSYGAVGFVVAAFVGVPLAKYGLKKGLAQHTDSAKLDREFTGGIMKKDNRDAMGYHTIHPANLDTMSFHFALLGVAFFFTWCICYLMKTVLPNDISALGYGLMFMWGMLIALVMRKLINRAGIEHLLDDHMIHRMNGLCVDFMIITALMSVQWGVLSKYIIPFVITVVLASLLLFLWFWIPSRWLGKSGLERFLMNYAAATGTLASSLLLMRIIDPKGKSMVSAEMGFSQFVLIIPVAPLALFILPTLGVKTDVESVFTIGLFILAACTAVLLLLKKTGYWQGGE